MSNDITPDMLIQYLDNELGPQDRALIDSALANDAGLQQQLERLRLSKQAFGLYARRQQVASIHAEMMQELPAAKSSATPVRFLRMAMRVAALIVVLALIAGLVQYSLLEPGKLYSSQYQPFELSTPRGDDSVSALRAAYGLHNMTQVISIYESYSAHQAGDYFLAGQAYLATNAPEKAIAAFDAQLKLNESLTFKPYQDDAEYYLGLAWLKAGRADKALALFQKIHDHPSHAYNSEVSGWYLTRLRWLKRKQGY